MPLIPQPTREQQPWILSSIPKTFVLRILSPSQVLYVGKVHAIASSNAYGPFDILPGHTNFISIIFKRLIIYPEQGDSQEFALDTGILRFVNNTSDLYLGIEVTQVLQALPQVDFDFLREETQEKVDLRKQQQASAS